MLTTEQAFLHVVESGSFKKAAEHLNIEASSLSRKITALEERLNIKLLNRSTSKTQPTETGRSYYEGLRRIVDEQMALEEKITSGASTMNGRLRIGSTVDLGDKFIVPVVNSMQKKSPELSIEMILGSEFVDIAARHLDVAIRIGSMPDSGLIAKRLGDISRVLVASPSYLKKYGVPKAVDDLADHYFVLYSPEQAKSDIEFLDGERFPHMSINSKLCVNSLRALRALVREGAGIHWGPLWLYKNDLECGRLIRLYPSKPVKGFSIYAVYPARAFLSKKTQIFIQKLSEEISQYD